jgi:hypothetical protein
MAQGVQEQIGVLTAIEPKGHFFQIGRKVLGADLVPSSHDAALEKRERRFNGVGVDVAHDIDAAAVLDGLVPDSRNVGVFHCKGIGGEVIHEDHVHILANVLADVLGNCSGLYVLSVEHAKLAIALPDADYDFLFRSASGKPVSLGTVLSLSADVGFIYLDLSVEHGLLRFNHCSANTMAQAPSRLIASDSERALNLAGRYALLPRRAAT